MARCNCDSACSCLIIGGDTECIEVNVTGTGSAANPYVISADFICLGPNAGGTLGYEEITATQSGFAEGVETDITGLTTTVTVGTGRLIRITGHCRPSATNANGIITLRIRDEVTVRQLSQIQIPIAGVGLTEIAIAIENPAAGSHTYKLTLTSESGAGAAAMNASVDNPAYILVEDIGAA